MSRTSVRNWDRLNAYVDGELSPDDAAETAAAIAGDPALAREVAALSRLKAVSAEALAMDPDDVPPIAARRMSHSATKFPVRIRALAAAFLLMIAAAAAFGSFMAVPEPNDELVIWRARAREHFLAWTAADAVEPQANGGGDLRIEASGTTDGLPDLSVARLTIAHAVAATAREPAGLFVGYVGSRGCRLGLWIAPAPAGLSESLEIVPATDVMRAAWRAAGTGYEALASGMDEARFRAIADYLVHLTRRQGGQEPLRMAADRRVMTARCVG